MNLFDLSIPIDYLPYIIAGSFGLVLLFFLWQFVIKPKLKYPLRNEQDEGTWTVPLLALGKMGVGQVTTARHYFEGFFSTFLRNVLRSSSGIEEKQRLEMTKRVVGLRDTVLKFYLFAQTADWGRVIYFYDGDPLDPKYNIRYDEPSRFGSDRVIRFIGPVQDCISVGQDAHGIEIIGVKLSKEQAKFTDEERSLFVLCGEALRDIHLAAANSQMIGHITELYEDEKLVNANLMRSNRKLATERDTAHMASSSHPLATPALPSAPPSVLQTIGRKFFSKGQVIIGLVAIITYVVLTNILITFQISVPDPNTMGLIAGLGVFFGVPIIRGWIHR